MAATKFYLWKNGKPITSANGLEIQIADKETGEFGIKGADIAMFTQLMVVIPENQKETTDDSVQSAN